MAENRIRVRDFTSLVEPSDSVVLVHFEEIGGTIHVYRDGTVVLSSPSSTGRASVTVDNKRPHPPRPLASYALWRQISR
jgi:hypothetical protein